MMLPVQEFKFMSRDNFEHLSEDGARMRHGRFSPHFQSVNGN